MDPKDRKLLNRLQENFPLVERPYKQIAAELGLTEKEVIGRMGKMYAGGIVRRFGLLINHKKMNYFSTLLGVKVSAARLPELIKFAASRPEVTHCYEREGKYNLWFTFLTPKKAIFTRFFAGLEKKFGANNILNLPTVKSHKLQTTFKV